VRECDHARPLIRLPEDIVIPETGRSSPQCSALRTSGPLEWSEHEPAWLLGLSRMRQACVNVVPLSAEAEPASRDPGGRPPPPRAMSLSRAWDSGGTTDSPERVREIARLMDAFQARAAPRT
jgi:hypothetical protein